MELKSYFCPRCGRSFNRKEAVITDDRPQCVYCRDTNLWISGWAYILLAMFLGVAAYLARKTGIQVHGQLWIFLAAAFGLFLIGVILMIKEHVMKRHPIGSATQDDLNEEREGKASATAETPDAAATADTEAGQKTDSQATS